MESVSLTAYVQVAREPQALKSLGWTAVVVLMAIAVVGGLARGNTYSVICLIPLALAFGAGKRARSTSEMRQIAIKMSCSGPLLTIFLPGARLFDGRYLDQEYASAREDVDSVSFDVSGTFRLRARQTLSSAYCGRQLVAQHEVQYAEVSFKVDREAQERLTEFLNIHGFEVADSSVPSC